MRVWLLCRGDKENDQKQTDVANENVERSKRFDEEACSVSRERSSGKKTEVIRKDEIASGSNSAGKNERNTEIVL